MAVRWYNVTSHAGQFNLAITHWAGAISTPRLRKKNKQNYFCYNYVRPPPNLTIFGRKMANSLKLYEVHSIFTSPDSCQCTTMLNIDVPNCYITL